MRATKIEWDNFFEGFLWEDLKEILQEGIDIGTSELMNPEITDLNVINVTRGKLENLLWMRDSLADVINGRFEEDQEELVSDGEDSIND